MYPIVPAGPSDFPELIDLMNSAYRGEYSKNGWTSEADLFQGSIRIDEQELKEHLSHPNSIMFKCTDDSGHLAGCVYLDLRGGRLYLGMLTVSPELQGAGIGKKLLQAAEDYARSRQIKSIYMGVISIRHELIAWYERHGYHPNGATKPYPMDNRLGAPKEPQVFVMLEKMM